MINTKPFCYYGFVLHDEPCSPYIFYDWESASLNPKTTQPLELGAVMIDPRKLEIIPDSLFCSKIKPLSDEEAIKKGLDTVQRSALAVNKLTLEELQDAPTEKTVWENFVQYVYKYNVKKDSWNSPISVGYNNNNFDIHIVNRLCEWYGPWDEKKKQQKIFNPIQALDLKDFTFMLNENNPAVERNSFDAVRDWLGLERDGTEHSAATDVMQGASVFCKIARLLRSWSKRTDFGGGK